MTSGLSALNEDQIEAASTRRSSLIVAAAFLVLAGPRASGGAAPGEELRIAAASDLHVVLPAIVAQFERETGRQVAVTYGSSGNFATQIENGAPFDLFLSADIDYPNRLIQRGLAEHGTLYEYATGRLMLWTRRDSGVDVRQGLSALTDARVHHIAIANPAHAPYGRAAVAALRQDHLLERVQHKFILGENVGQAAQFAQSGAAEVGVLALALAQTPALKDTGAYVEIPPNTHPPIEQGAVVLARSRQKPLAARFVDALKQPASIRLLESNGFAVPRD